MAHTDDHDPGPYRTRDAALSGDPVPKAGTVVRVLPGKAFVFLGADDEAAEYFAHKSAFVAPQMFHRAQVGQRVTFDAIQTSKGPRAQQITVLE